MRFRGGLVVLLGVSSMLVGCTNVAGDAIRVIEAPAERQENLFASIEHTLRASGYECHAAGEGHRYRCDKALRNLFIHQTRAVIEVFPDADVPDSYFVMATRWDEGLIPGELISSEYHSADVVALCKALEDSSLGRCRVEAP